MRKAGLSIALSVTALGVAMLLAFMPITSVAIALAATALYMGGTGHPLSVPQDTPAYIASYVDDAGTTYVAPSGLCVGGSPGCSPVAVYTPEQFPIATGLPSLTFDESVAIGLANLDGCLRGAPCTVTKPPFTTTGPPEVVADTSYVVYGYSQSATISAQEKYDLIAHPPPVGTTISFVQTSNPNRPNGGILERFVGAYIPLLGVTFDGAMTTNSPQPTPLTTVDVAHQYDPVADFPTNPLNLVADLNALFGFLYFHPETAYFAVNTVELQGQYQDTTYYLAPAETLPLLMPIEQIPLIGPPLAATLDPPLRVLVEAGYDRTVNPGQPTPAKYLYFPGPLKTAINFLVAIPTGWDNGIAAITGNPANRPFHTQPQGTYGVGGPPVDTGAVDPYGPPTPYTPAPLPPASSAATSQREQKQSRPVAAIRHRPTRQAPASRPGNRAAPGLAGSGRARVPHSTVSKSRSPHRLAH
ncbi:PE-PPE domain-containing protein [Mycobacterium sp. CVI_P3]|uniref:PE-PPE domain-containing protein n=1 Tax=Mycobacterium pinniadriaticum TaxID=2994102 RepID=A0ABT3SCX9_9MYCO|nr:PE-PPE domain-containing protein [Mycobacterium pinniadriaticum]MCX2930937.1 PE-PPE domain-containing protein [Mycobacterium pinniadriaticum]MCX2937361.1 PE-PPE domain-containing protein [Mycobacterium pinniadriaticum]